MRYMPSRHSLMGRIICVMKGWPSRILATASGQWLHARSLCLWWPNDWWRKPMLACLSPYSLGSFLCFCCYCLEASSHSLLTILFSHALTLQMHWFLNLSLTRRPLLRKMASILKSGEQRRRRWRTTKMLLTTTTTRILLYTIHLVISFIRVLSPPFLNPI